MFDLLSFPWEPLHCWLSQKTFRATVMAARLRLVPIVTRNGLHACMHALWCCTRRKLWKKDNCFSVLIDFDLCSTEALTTELTRRVANRWTSPRVSRAQPARISHLMTGHIIEKPATPTGIVLLLPLIFYATSYLEATSQPALVSQRTKSN